MMLHITIELMVYIGEVVFGFKELLRGRAPIHDLSVFFEEIFVFRFLVVSLQA